MVWNLYEKEVSKNGRVTYKPLDWNKIFIKGRSLNELIELADLIDTERHHEMRLCRANLQRYAEIYRKQEEEIIKNTINDMFKEN